MKASKITLDKNALLNKKTFAFETKDKDDCSIAEIDHTDRSGFRIWFNGQFLFVGKSFSSLQKRFDKLVDKWDLEVSQEIN